VGDMQGDETSCLPLKHWGLVLNQFAIDFENNGVRFVFF
jgi:hypothetical protein